MDQISRREILKRIVLNGARTAIVVAGVTAIPNVSASMPWALDNAKAMQPKSFVEKAQVVVVRRHRRWSCWWFRAVGCAVGGNPA